MKVRDLIATPFRISFLAFAVFQAVFFICANWDWLPEIFGGSYLFVHDRVVSSQTTFLIFLVHLLVTANTTFFIFEFLKILKFTSKLAEANQNSAEKSFKIIISILIISVGISGYFAYTYAVVFISNNIGPSPSEWLHHLHLNEIWLIVLFALFVLADYLLLKMCSLYLSDSGLGDFEVKLISVFRDNTRIFVLACDWPGLMGIIFILFLSLSLRSSDVGSYPELQNYLHGFIVGAIGLHIAFSQAALAFLSE